MAPSPMSLRCRTRSSSCASPSPELTSRHCGAGLVATNLSSTTISKWFLSSSQDQLHLVPNPLQCPSRLQHCPQATPKLASHHYGPGHVSKLTWSSTTNAANDTKQSYW
ncbi:hypothetical protein SESBI_40034 [Sesbania bispinosa]|nr:hypothetical protein SESBI_40034 [Sesbania bispinosa]